MNLHHIGIATENIEKTEEMLKYFGYIREGAIAKDSLQGVYVLFLKHPTAPLIELICEEENGNHSPIQEILKKNGTSLYHLCFEAENIDDTIAKLRAQGYLPTGRKQPSLIEGRNVIFLYHSHNCLIELLERKINE